MKKIDDYIESLYKNIDGNAKEISEFKIEMRSHLYDTVKELMASGKSEEESIDIAIKRFGDAGQINKELPEVLDIPRKYINNILRTAIVFLVIGSVAFLAVFSYSLYFKLIQREMINKVFTQLKQDPQITESTKEKIESIIKTRVGMLNLNYFAIFPSSYNVSFDSEDFVNRLSKAEFLYPSSARMKEIVSKDGARSITTNTYSISDVPEWKLEWQFFGQKPNRNMINNAGYLFLACLMIYWVLFIVWASLKAHDVKQMNIMWLIVFSILNVLGYAIFSKYQKAYQRNF